MTFEGTATMTIDLTRRQREIADLLSKGFANKEIAERLEINRRTVEEHRAKIYVKMGVRNAVQLTRKMLGITE